MDTHVKTLMNAQQPMEVAVIFAQTHKGPIHAVVDLAIALAWMGTIAWILMNV